MVSSVAVTLPEAAAPLTVLPNFLSYAAPLLPEFLTKQVWYCTSLKNLLSVLDTLVLHEKVVIFEYESLNAALALGMLGFVSANFLLTQLDHFGLYVLEFLVYVDLWPLTLNVIEPRAVLLVGQ